MPVYIILLSSFPRCPFKEAAPPPLPLHHTHSSQRLGYLTIYLQNGDVKRLHLRVRENDPVESLITPISSIYSVPSTLLDARDTMMSKPGANMVWTQIPVFDHLFQKFPFQSVAMFFFHECV